MAQHSKFKRRLRSGAVAATLLAATAGLTFAELTLPAWAQIAVINQGYVPFSDAPINYRTQKLNDPVAVLQKQIEQGKAELVWDKDHGYLRSVLALLEVPISSQTLVFSKTSFQSAKIDPEHPRALYYNDDVYVGAVHNGKAIEIVSFDPVQGAIFYLIDEPKADKPVFQRAELDCTQCHIAPATRGVPGVLIRSVQPRLDGSPARGVNYITDQKSPLSQRWGGWYVDGELAKSTMANAAIAATDASTTAPFAAFAKRFDAAAYVAPNSDDVALLVLGHQVQMHNLFTLTNYQTRLALYDLAQQTGGDSAQGRAIETLPEKTRLQIERPAEQLLRHLLFSGETSLGGADAKKIFAGSQFAQEFQARGVRDSKKRSLRDFDLHDRTFRYPCSYLIYNSAFDAIPEPAKAYIYHRLLQVLSGEDQSPDFANLSASDREAILSILLETKPGLPAEWKAYAQTHGLRTARADARARDYAETDQAPETKGR